MVTDYGASYRAPTANSTVCPTVPVDTFDVSPE
ncbi:StfH/YfcO family fimbrial adhesin [Escherichia coli]